MYIVFSSEYALGSSVKLSVLLQQKETEFSQFPEDY